MLFARSGRSLKSLVRRHPEILPTLKRVLGAVLGIAPGGLVDPDVVAHVAHVSPQESIGYLQFLHEAGGGSFVVRVVDPGGHELRRFATIAEIPAMIEDEFGDVHNVTPELIDIAFDPDRSVLEEETRALAGLRR